MMENEDAIVITFQERLKTEQRSNVIGMAEKAFPDRKVIILDGGAMVGTVGQAAMLERIEAKLDALLNALADDEEEDQYDLDGNPVDAVERQAGESLD